MKIMMFTDNYVPQINGVAVHVHAISLELAKRGHTVYICAPKSKQKATYRYPKNIKVYYFNSIPFIFYKDVRLTTPLSFTIMYQMMRLKPDIVHFHTPLSLGFNAVLAAEILKLPLVGTFHTYFMEEEYLRIVGLDKLTPQISEWIQDAGWSYSNFFYNKADVVITPSQFTKEDLKEHGIVKKIEVVSNGIPALDPKKIRTKKRILPKKYFLYAGRLSKEKDLKILIDAYAYFHSTSPDTELIIVGSGPDEERLKSIAEKKNLDKFVHFLGKIPHIELIQSPIYKNALAFITPSTSEIQPISILEAMQFGLPIIGAKSRGVSELIDNNGILCKPHNAKAFAQAMKKIASDSKMRQEYSKASIEIARGHAIEKTIVKLEAIYENIVTR